MKQLPMNLQTIVSIPFEENAYIAHREGECECLVVDPGLEPQKIIEFLHENKLTPGAILNTHGHADHIAGNAAIKKQWPECPLVIGASDVAKLTDPMLNLSAAFGIELISPPADILLDDGQIYSAVGFEMKIVNIAGHSPGHIAFIMTDYDPAIVFVGDIIFAGSIGRTDFPDGNFQQLADGIWNKLFTLPDDTLLLPGHGPSTTVGEEKENNPYVGSKVMGK